jgi:hypothetical protein
MAASSLQWLPLWFTFLTLVALLHRMRRNVAHYPKVVTCRGTITIPVEYVIWHNFASIQEPGKGQRVLEAPRIHTSSPCSKHWSWPRAQLFRVTASDLAGWSHLSMDFVLGDRNPERTNGMRKRCVFLHLSGVCMHADHQVVVLMMVRCRSGCPERDGTSASPESPVKAT